MLKQVIGSFHDLKKEYLETKIVYFCTCGKGKRIKGHSYLWLVEVNEEGFCTKCRHAAIARRIYKSWNPSHGIFEKYRVRGAF